MKKISMGCWSFAGSTASKALSPAVLTDCQCIRPHLTAMVLVCCCVGGGGGGGPIELAALFVFIYTFFTPFDFSLFSVLLLLFSVLSFLPFFFSFSLPFSGQLLEAALDRLTEHCICLQCSRRSGRITAAAATRAIVGDRRWRRQRKRKRK